MGDRLITEGWDAMLVYLMSFMIDEVDYKQKQQHFINYY